jgi:predicted ATP-grasp superfamily ATP-dependent carboligase
METVINKDKTYEIAKKIGITTPVNYDIDKGVIPDEIRFPVILKWANPNIVSALLNKHQIPLLKCEYCYTNEELKHALDRYQALDQQPLVQSYCPGHGLGHLIYMHQGKAILCFQHKRIHEWPPEGGVSTLCESIDLSENAALFIKSIELLQTINWEGPAMVEYKVDAKTGDSFLMEINGRFWGSLPLAHYAGAHFAWTHYLVNVLNDVPDQPKILFGIRCMFVIPEFKRLIKIIFQRKSIQDKSLCINVWQDLSIFIAHIIKGRYFYVFDLNDPRPFFEDIWNTSLGRILNSRLFS